MSIELRDQIAIAAMTGPISKHILLRSPKDLEFLSELAYRLADAMIEARSKTNTDSDEYTTT